LGLPEIAIVGSGSGAGMKVTGFEWKQHAVIYLIEARALGQGHYPSLIFLIILINFPLSFLSA
jgi:hypothetical protein